jgi:Gas vesicle synthesis protein GvpL/GvpF
VADPLHRWAAGRAPDLLARAEAEAVGTLRDALVDAALAERRKREDRAASSPPPPEPRRTSRSAATALWTYGVLAADAPLDASRLEGVDTTHPVRLVRDGDLAALASHVPLDEYGADPLRRNLNDLSWLERVARAHESVLETAVHTTTCVPLRLCTIYESEESLREMLRRERAAFTHALRQLAGRQEWAVKLLVDGDALTKAARALSDEVAGLEDDARGRSEGGAYMLRRRIDRHVRDRAAALATDTAEEVHARLESWAIDAVTRPPQNRELSGHEGEMLLNGAYLVEAERVDGLRELVAELERDYDALGARIELSGPWPPYNFVPGGTGTAP